MILDRLIYLTKWILYMIPEVSFAALFFVFVSKKDEKMLAYPIFYCQYIPFLIFSRFANGSKAAKAVKIEKER